MLKHTMEPSVDDLGRVLEDAVERNPWGKSSSDLLCRFPNTGGLHLTSGDAPLDTQNISDNNGTNVAKYDNYDSNTFTHISGETTLTSIPSWCHVHSSNTPSSKTTRLAARSFKELKLKSAFRTTKHKRDVNTNTKRFKQVQFLKDVKVCNVASERRVKFMTEDDIKRRIVVCDGGDTADDGINTDTSSSTNVHLLRIRDGDLWIADTVNATLGLRFISPGEKTPVFIRLPRIDSLSIMNDGRRVCSAMRSCASTQRQSLVRGIKNHVFTEKNNKYCCVGAQPGRAERGVQSGLYRLKNGFRSNEWDSLHKLLKRGEYAFDKYIDTDIIRHVSCAKSTVNFKTMEPSPSSSDKKSARYFNGLGFGINVYLRSHIDHDFTMSIVQVHIDNHVYQRNDPVLCYFAFPRIGIAVPLRPGDFLLFNTQEPHSISSRCRKRDEIYCISSYLKTMVVGGNDNSKKNLL